VLQLCLSRTFAVLLAYLLSGCVSGSKQGAALSHPTLARRYYGAWQNIDSRYLNWWVIGANGAVGYGLDSEGKCGTGPVLVTGPDQIDVKFGNSGVATLRLAEDGLLIFQIERGFAVYRRVDATSICRKPDGTYLERPP
jgi:hypothetical protein